MDIQKYRSRIAEMMDERGWDKEELAVQAGLPQCVIYRMFDKDPEVSYDTFMSIARAFDIKFWGLEKDIEEHYIYIDQTISKQQRELIKLTSNVDRELVNKIVTYARFVVDDNTI